MAITLSPKTAGGLATVVGRSGVIEMSDAMGDPAETAFLDGVVAGTAAASKAVVLGTSREIATMGAITMDGLLTITDTNVVLSTTTGTQIGTATAQKLAFYGTTPVNQPLTVGAPSGGATIDAESRTAIGSIISRLQELGLIA